MLIYLKLPVEKERKGNLFGAKFSPHIVLVESFEGFVYR
jgi:hypothetical protein